MTSALRLVRWGARSTAVALCGGAWLALVACGSPLPTPRTGPHMNDHAHVVPFPPPPVRVDVVGPAPSNAKDLVWVDGQWTWSVSRWIWQRGYWAEQRPDEHYAPPVFYRNSNDDLLWFEGAFIDAKGERVAKKTASK